MRFHKIANVNKALDYITSKGVKLVSIGAEGEIHVYMTFEQMSDSFMYSNRVCVSQRLLMGM